jgi:fatty-acyl-CoA synthase
MPYVATMCGLKQVFPGKYEIPLVCALIQNEKVTFSHCVPTILQKVILALADAETRLSGWKVIVGGAPFSKALARQAAEVGIQTYGGYGLSETCPVLTMANLKPAMETWDEEQQLDVLIKPGFTIPLVQLKVVDPEGKEVKRDGHAMGEVLARSPWCTAGYLGEPELSEALWEGGWLHTQDVATIDEHGYIQIVDRIKDMIKSGGEWIASAELERLICLVEGVQDVAVIGVPDEIWGERPLAIVALRPKYRGKITAEGLRAALNRYVEAGVLSAWSVPEQYVYVDEIPKTGVGKPDKKTLRSQFQQTAPLPR